MLSVRKLYHVLPLEQGRCSDSLPSSESNEDRRTRVIITQYFFFFFWPLSSSLWHDNIAPRAQYPKHSTARISSCAIQAWISAPKQRHAARIWAPVLVSLCRSPFLFLAAPVHPISSAYPSLHTAGNMTEHWDFTGTCPRFQQPEGKQVMTWVPYCPRLVLAARVSGNFLGYALLVLDTASFLRGVHAVSAVDVTCCIVIQSLPARVQQGLKPLPALLTAPNTYTLLMPCVSISVYQLKPMLALRWGFCQLETAVTVVIPKMKDFFAAILDCKWISFVVCIWDPFYSSNFPKFLSSHFKTKAEEWYWVWGYLQRNKIYF